MLKLVDVHTYYGDTHILRGISLEVAKQSLAAILGRNGMGKTTLVHSIIGFNPPRFGEILFKGNKISGLPPYKISQMGVGLVPQGRRIFPSLRVKKNLTIAERGERGDRRWSLERVCTLFPILKARANTKGTLLSGGEQQILAIARTLLTSPELLMMDEPSEGLAPLLVQQIGQVISQLRNEGLSILLVEQNLKLALELSDYVHILNMGEIVYQCTAEELEGNRNIQAEHLGVR